MSPALRAASAGPSPRGSASDGFTVIINYASDCQGAAALAQKIEAKGGRALTAKADVTDPNAVRLMFDTAEAAFGGVDVLVNNAGIMKLTHIADTDDALFDQHDAINIKGTFNGLREAARRLRDGGRIISLSTSQVGLKFETYGVYAATKAAVETMTAVLAKELRGRSISVNAVAPGPTATDFFFDGKSPELIERFAKTPPLERLGTAPGRRRRRLVPCWPRRWLDQRTGAARQRRLGLTPRSRSPGSPPRDTYIAKDTSS